MKNSMRISVSALLCMAAAFGMWAGGKLTNRSYAFLNDQKNESVMVSERRSEAATSSAKRVSRRKANRSLATVGVDGVKYVKVLVNAEGWNTAPISEMEKMGAAVNTQVGNVLVVTVPVDKLEALSELKGVRQVAVSNRMHLHNDCQRTAANVDKVLAGTGLSMPYTGKDVVVGMIDTGIEFNHIAFKDASGNTRVKRVYMSEVTSGNHPVIDGETLPGSEYVTAEEIAKLTTDATKETHGTHTSATAAGSKVGSYGGMAPEADIVLCGMGDDLSDTGILCALKYIFNYAESVGKPAVVNMSLGDHAGTHDGTSDFCKAMNDLVDDGHLIVLSAGNEGDYGVHFSTTFENSGTNTAQKTVLLSDSDYYGGYYLTELDIVSKSKTPFYVQFVVVDSSGKEVATSKKQSASAAGTTFDMDGHSTFKNYYSGSATVYSQVDANSGKYYVYISAECETTSDNDRAWYLGVKFYGAKDEVINGWASDGYTSFTNNGYSKYIDGDSNSSISAMATGNNTISVGAFNTRKGYPNLDGGMSNLPEGYNVGEISLFSSYGPDMNGLARPEVLGGGATVVSAVNRFDSSTVGDNTALAQKVTDGDITYYWGGMSGTSMSSPQVAGIVALWLQADKSLSVTELKDVLKNSSIRDNVVTSNPNKSGYGKIDALAGLKYLISKSGINEVKTSDANLVVYPNPSDGNFTVVAPGEDAVKVCVYSVNGAEVYNKTLETNGGMAEVSLAGRITPGVYVVSVTCSNVSKSSRMIVK